MPFLAALGLVTGLLASLGPLSAPSARAEAPVVSQYKVEPPPHLTVGGRVLVTIVVEADEGTQVQIAPGSIPRDLALAESVRSETRSKGSGRVEVRLELVLAPFVVGDYAVPPLKLRYRGPGGASGELETPASRLLIESTIPPNQPVTPRDLKPQAEIGAVPAPPYELVALAGAAFALAVGLLIVAWRRTKRPIAEAAVAEPEAEALAPEDAARRSLDAAAARFSAEGDSGAYYAALSNAVRRYLTERFGFPAFALTTAELQMQMTFRGMDRWQARLVGGLLEQCDAVTYARYRPAPERADADLTAAYEIVEMSRPQAEAALEVAIS